MNNICFRHMLKYMKYEVTREYLRDNKHTCVKLFAVVISFYCKLHIELYLVLLN